MGKGGWGLIPASSPHSALACARYSGAAEAAAQPRLHCFRTTSTRPRQRRVGWPHTRIASAY